MILSKIQIQIYMHLKSLNSFLTAFEQLQTALEQLWNRFGTALEQLLTYLEQL